MPLAPAPDPTFASAPATSRSASRSTSRSSDEEPRARAVRRLPSLLGAALLLLAACGGGGVPALPAPFEIDAPVGPGPGGPPPGTTPPPAPPQAPVWNPDAAGLGRTATFGSFPSDLVPFGDTLFVNDADQIEVDGARIVPLDVSGFVPAPSTSFTTFTLHASSLRDSLGQAADLATPIGFGFYVNDFVIASDRLGFVLVNAGGSDSAPTLSNVVAFDPTTGALRQVVNLATPYANGGPLLDSGGTPAPGQTFVQSGAETLAYVPTPSGGLLYVGMSNLLVGAPSFGAVKHRGTVQVFDVAPAGSPVVTPRPAAGLATQTFLTGDYNPVAMSTFVADPSPGGMLVPRLLVTLGGTTGYDASFSLVPVTPASVEVYDADSVQYRGRIRLGLAGLAGTRPALGKDAAGHHVGFYPSSTTGEIYLLRLDGVRPWEIDPSKIQVLRAPGNGIPITAAQAGGPGGNVTGVGLSPDGRTLAVAGFGNLFAFPDPVPGQLALLNLPPDVVTGSGFGVSFVPGSARYGSVSGRTLGSLVLRAGVGGRPDVFVLVGGAMDLATFLGSGPASLGTLQTFGLVH
jgi:hypothetical protein